MHWTILKERNEQAPRTEFVGVSSVSFRAMQDHPSQPLWTVWTNRKNVAETKHTSGFVSLSSRKVCW